MKACQLLSLFTIFLLLLIPSTYALKTPSTGQVDDIFNTVKETIKKILPLPMRVGVEVIEKAVSYITNKLTKKSDSKKEGVYTGGKAPTREELLNDTDVKNTFANLQSDVEEEAVKDLLALRQQLRSTLVSYSYDREGHLADIRVSIKGPDKIYGFSAFPISVNIYAPCPKTPEQNKVHIEKITVYVRDAKTGQKWWEQTWTGYVTLRNSDHTWYFMLKTPDPYCGKAKSAVNGNPDKKTLDELLNAEVDKFEVCVEIEGYREKWIWEERISDSGRTYKVAVHVDDIPIDAKLISLSAWRHEKSGIYEIDGMEGSLPARFADVREYTAYKTRANGAVSNMIVRTWATPVHTLDSTADYKFCFIANPDYFDPFDPSIVDDVAIYTYRIFQDGSSAIVSRAKHSCGDLGTINTIATTMHYKADDRTSSFDTYFVMYAEVKTNGRTLPIWLVAKPAITVLSNREVVLADERVEEIASLLEKEDITEEDIERIKQIASTMVSGFESKKQTAIDLKAKCANNDVARKYAEKAIDYYNAALKALEKLQATDDPAQIATQLKLAKNYEMMADYYADAAEKALYGLTEQAEIDVRNAQKIEEVTKKYEPSIMYKVGSSLGNAWKSFKSGIGIGNISDWSLVTIAIFVLICIVIIVVVIGIVISILKIF